MSWTVVAKKDVRDAGRSKALWGLSVLFVLLSALLVYAFGELLPGGTDLLGLIGSLRSPMSLFIPVIALLVGHKALVGERETGSIKFLLSLPHTRLDAVLGKLVGRTVVLWVAVVLGFLTGMLVWLGVVGSFAVGPFAVFGLLTLLFGVAYTSVAVAVSAATRSGSRATALAVGVWLVFEFLWDLVVLALQYVANGFDFGATLESMASPPGWAQPLRSLNPSSAYGNAVTTLVPGLQEALGAALGDSVFVSAWWSLLVLLAWVVLPAAFGYRRFSEADL